MELAKFKRKHVPDILSWIHNEAEMVQWAGPIFDWPLTQKQFRNHLQAANTNPPTLYPFGLYHRSKIVGYCEISDHHRNSNSAMVSRVLIAPKKRNNGLAQFMLKELLEFGFNKLNLHRIWLGVFDFNKTAIKCYKNAGFIHEGTVRESAKAGNVYWNCHIMAILRKEWQT